MNPDLLPEFARIPELIQQHAHTQGARAALQLDHEVLSYADLHALMDRCARALQRDGLVAGDCVAICANGSIAYALAFLGALRAGLVVAPLSPSASADSLARMLADAQAKALFTDAASAAVCAQVPVCVPRIALDGSTVGHPWQTWLAAAGEVPAPVAIAPDAPFNIIYSSGTTGEPKGIVQPHRMRWAHVRRGATYGYGPHTRSLLSTPLYSNTTLVVFFPTLALGGCVVLMPKFDALAYLQQAQRERITHTMLVPVQYQRLMARADFGQFDLSSFVTKFSTSAPFSAALKADVLARWPGALVEFYGMTEGGGTCILEAHLHPDKLHTVGRAAPGHDIRLIDEHGHEVAAGELGEVVGHSPGMMQGYHRKPEQTREAEWFDAQGKRFIRTGDMGRFDADGFLSLLDRRKDLIISGGFNVYPSDIEAVLQRHPAVAEVAVVGLPSEQWGETPVAFVVPRAHACTDSAALLQWSLQHLGKTQRVSDVRWLAALPRSPIGKVLKRELRQHYLAGTLK